MIRTANSSTILLVTSTFVSHRVFLRELALRLVARGWTVHLATSSTNYPGEVPRDAEVAIHEIDFPRGASLWSYVRASRQLRSLVATVRPTIIHGHLHPAILTLALAHKSDWPVTLGTFQGLVHTILPRGPKRWLYRQIERWACRQLDRAWVLTKGDLDALSLPNVARQRAPGFGANQEVFAPRRFHAGDRAEQRRELGIPDNAVVCCYVGRQTHFKGFPETARAALEVVAQREQVHFILVGTTDPRHGDGLDDATRRRLVEHPQIHLLGWSDDVARLLFASDIFVFPSAREGLAVSIMEALSMGLPVVTTSARGCRELVEPGVTGWIVPRDPRRIAQQIVHICDDPRERQRLAANVLACREKFSREHFINEQVALYEALNLNPRVIGDGT